MLSRMLLTYSTKFKMRMYSLNANVTISTNHWTIVNGMAHSSTPINMQVHEYPYIVTNLSLSTLMSPSPTFLIRNDRATGTPKPTM